MKLEALALFLVVAACAGTASQIAQPGETFQTEHIHQAGRVKLWVPPGWQVDDGAPDTLVMTSPDRAVSLEVTVLEAKDLPAALVAVAAAALVGFDELQLVGAPVGGNIHGMDALFQDGRGTFHGRPVALTVGVLDTPAEKFLLVVGEADAEAYPAHAREIRDVMSGIRPL